MPPPPGLAFFLLLPPTDIVTTCGVLHRRIEITRVNLTFDLISENVRTYMIAYNRSRNGSLKSLTSIRFRLN